MRIYGGFPHRHHCKCCNSPYQFKKEARQAAKAEIREELFALYLDWRLVFDPEDGSST